MPRDLQKDLELCNEATKGPWYVGAKENGPNRLIANVSYFGFGKIYTRGQDANPGADIMFIAAAREGWPEAIKRAMESEAKVKELEGRIDVLSTVVNMHCSPYYDMMERAEKAEALNKKLLDCLHKVIRQACEDRNGKYDSMCLTAYADAMELLGRFGLLEIRIAYGRSVVAVDKKEQA